MRPAQDEELGKPGRDLRGSEQGGRGDRLERRRPRALDQPRKVRAHGPRDEPRGGEDEGQERHLLQRPPACRRIGNPAQMRMRVGERQEKAVERERDE